LEKNKYFCTVIKNRKMEQLRHYKFTGKTKIINHPISGEEVVLHQIQATQDIPSNNVKKGDLGGWIEKYENLKGNGWVGKDCCVYDNARVQRYAGVSGNVHVFGYAWIADTIHVNGSAFIT
jgi:hypothetical protein